MQLLDGTFVYSATDLNNYLECKHLVLLSRDVAEGRLTKPAEKDPTAELVAKKGAEHERERFECYKAEFPAEGKVVAFEPSAYTASALRDAEALTIEAMAAGAHIIYQATFFDGTFVGRTDFLRRVERPSRFGSWSYEVIDTKLALSPKPYFLIQLCNYSEHLERVQGVAPECGYVVFGSGEERGFRIAAYGAYYRHLKASFERWLTTGEDPYPREVAHCDVCVWTKRCEAQREADDYLGLVAGIRADQIAKFETDGIKTMTVLAESTSRPNRMTDATFDTLRIQAELQVEQRKAIAAGDRHPYRYRFREPNSEEPAAPPPAAPAKPAATKQQDGPGFAKLPAPANGDIFFDIEGDPLYRADRGLEYLFGLYLPDEDRYEAFWAKDPIEERAAFERCVDFISTRLRDYPDMHVYHYAPYEKTALGRLMGTFGSRENDVDQFFRLGVFVDLFPVVRQAMWISQPSYSLKKVEKFYRWRRDTHTLGGDESIVMFESWLATGDPGILEDIRQYNEDDCRSTHALREWLVQLRTEYNAGRDEPIPWRVSRRDVKEPEAPERTELEVRLLDDVLPPATAADLRAMPSDVRERWLLGNLLQYHRRENKPQYWEYFDRCANVEELAEFDRKAIGGLRRRDGVAPTRKSNRGNYVYSFEYPPQECDISNGAHCPDSQKAITALVSHDELARTIELRLSDEMARVLRALIPPPPLIHTSRQLGIERIAKALLAGRLAIDHGATSEMLRAATPRLLGRPLGATIQPPVIDGDSIARTIADLDRSYLFIQGPPGSGKSTFGAQAIVALLQRGQRVGLMANSHKALHCLIHKIEAHAEEVGFRFDGVHKMSESTEDSEFVSHLAVPMVRSESRVSAGDATLISGTAYLWPNEDFTGRFDTMVIDEAGQVSLADALNAALAARNVVLLGDPRQLPQVTQGSHPVGSGLSILEHLLGDADTVPPDRGIFLERSFRMQPDLARFVSETSYEGRLEAADNTVANRVDSARLSGGGLAYLPVEHEGNGRYSREEAERIVAEVRALVGGGTYVRDRQPPVPIRADDILIVAPYNRQRRLLRECLRTAGFGDSVAVGTVDKFQGQQAPVVFYSMATSSGDDLPRDMAFLFDRNRFNVAISRAQCLSVLVCSPRLLDARCRNPEQMELVSLLCGFVERAHRYPTNARAAQGELIRV